MNYFEGAEQREEDKAMKRLRMIECIHCQATLLSDTIACKACDRWPHDEYCDYLKTRECECEDRIDRDEDWYKDV